jgi:hypothetical protein
MFRKPKPSNRLGSSIIKVGLTDLIYKSQDYDAGEFIFHFKLYSCLITVCFIGITINWNI